MIMVRNIRKSGRNESGQNHISRAAIGIMTIGAGITTRAIKASRGNWNDNHNSTICLQSMAYRARQGARIETTETLLAGAASDGFPGSVAHETRLYVEQVRR